MIVTTRHVFTVRGFSPRPGFCRGGVKRWFVAHGLDYRDFVRNGIDESVLLALHDPFADATVAWAHKLTQERTSDHG